MHQAKVVECPRTILAGVVIPIYEYDNEVFFLLTKRTETVRFHKGEVSFPGGMYEENDLNTMKTALRECCEEIGVKRHDVEIIGRLDDVYTLTGFVIAPYVGIIPYPYEFHPNRQEVDYIINLPYTYLKQAKPEYEMAGYNGVSESVAAIRFNGDRIWGATYRILSQFKRIVENEEV
ncbi:MAG TPA: CoA pyrophosphatase [Syntrophorhabdaceae bacterium]|nr:CoA pyrophosphatase [Syntrophorhabdaceae bacterium]